MPHDILYVLSDARSGSTALTMLLGLDRRIFGAGELVHFSRLRDERHQGSGECTCGEKFTACPFWQKVVKGLEQDGHGSIKLEFRRESSHLRQLRRLQRLSKKQLRHEEMDVAGAADLLYNQIRHVSGARWIVDSSKWAERALIYNASPTIAQRLRTLYLVREPCSTVISKSERTGRSLSAAAFSWLWTNLKCALAFIVLPRRERLFVAFDDMGDKPDQTLQFLYRFMELDGREADAETVQHNLEGSPGRMKGKAFAWRQPPPPRQRISFWNYLWMLLLLRPPYWGLLILGRFANRVHQDRDKA